MTKEELKQMIDDHEVVASITDEDTAMWIDLAITQAMMHQLAGMSPEAMANAADAIDWSRLRVDLLEGINWDDHDEQFQVTTGMKLGLLMIGHTNIVTFVLEAVAFGKERGVI